MGRKISLIVAVGERFEIGKDLSLLWRLPNDLKHFKELTLGKVIVMGRRTWQSLPNGALPGRINVVLSSMERDQLPGMTDDVLLCHSIQEVLALPVLEDRDICFIGGYAVYREGLAYANRLYITYVESSFPEANVFFPAFDLAEWQEIEQSAYSRDEKHAYNYRFIAYERN